MRHRYLVAVCVGSTLASCDIEPSTPQLSFSLNAAVPELNEDLGDDRVAQDQLLGGLELLFGTPNNPGYLLVEDWVDEEYNPNWGDLELSEEDWEALLADNERAYSGQIEGIERGNFGDVRVPGSAIDLRRDWEEYYLADWQEIAAGIETGESTQADLDAYVAENVEDAVALFTDWYPTMRESAEFYRVQCLHCHGVDGGGDGPTSEFLEPRPRDYRPGKFKYTALGDKARPRRADLLNTLDQGINGTAMPSFRRFSAAWLNGAVDYVRLLSIRGETEIRLATEYDIDEKLPLEVVQQTYLDVWAEWDAAADKVIAYDGEIPESTPERIAHGRELFLDDTRANCVSCHGMNGRGDGASSYEKNEEGELVLVKDEWGNTIQPRDLTRGLFRFGRRPIDIYRRIYTGINGTPMPAHAEMKDPEDPSRRLMSDEDLWDIVHYVRSLSTHEKTTQVAAETASH